MILLHLIDLLEKSLFNFSFNKSILSIDKILTLADSHDFKFLRDKSVKYAISFKYNHNYICYYNPYLEQSELSLVIGHEFGHYLLKHFDTAPLHYAPESLFTKRGIEKDASVISFLMWYPTTKMNYLLNLYSQFDAELLYNEMYTCDTECKLYDYCCARLRIFKAYKYNNNQNYHKK